MFWLFDPNARKIRRVQKNRDRHYWQNVDAFGRHPSPPQAVKYVPALFYSGVWYVDAGECYAYDHEALATEKERFKKCVRTLTGGEAHSEGHIKKTPGRFVAINTLQGDIRVKASNLVLVNV